MLKLSAEGQLGPGVEEQRMTKTMARRAALLAALVLSLCGAASLAAQEIVETSGVVESIRGNRLAVKSGEQRWIVVIDGEELKLSGQRTELEFHGRGRGSLVERGWWVRFFADVDATGKVVGPLRTFTWFTPDHLTREGAFPVEPRDDGGEPTDDGGEPTVHWNRPQRGEMIAGRYLIVGSIRSVRDGHMLVIFQDERGAETQVLAQLDPDIDIEINITHKQVAGKLLARGDSVVVRGRAHENQLQAMSVVARREEVLGKPLPQPRAPRQ